MSQLEPVIARVEKIKIIPNRLKTAASLKPGLQMMDGCLVGNPMALAIRDAWQFATNRATRVIVVSREEYVTMTEKVQMNFGG